MMTPQEIKEIFEAKAIEQYGSVFMLSKEVPGLHYNVFRRYRNDPEGVKLSTLIKLLDLVGLKITVDLK